MAKVKEEKVESSIAKQEPLDNAETEMTKHGNIFEGYSDEEIEAMGGTTGTEDVPDEDRRPPLYVTNLETIDESGNRVVKNLFYDAQSGEQFDTINCSLLGFKKTRKKQIRDEATGEITVLCQSYDRKVGQLPNGDYKNCDKCQDKFSVKGKRKACSQIMRFVGWDFDREQFFVLNAKGSSFVPMSNFLEKNFLNQIKLPGTKKKGDIPLYMMNIQIMLKEEPADQGGFYYILQPKLIGTNPKETVMDLLPMAESIKSMTQQDVVQDGGDTTTDDDIPF